MLTLYHSPQSRSTRILALLHALNAIDRVDLRTVSIIRHDGSGRRDPSNPHPEGKVPLLVHDGAAVWESPAIMLHLTDLFPETGMDVSPGDPRRGEYLSWMVWYGSVMEPVLTLAAAGIDHPWLRASFRGVDEVTARLARALAQGPWIMGDRYTAVDLLLASPYLWFSDATPDAPAIRDWVARAAAQPCSGAALTQDAGLLAA
jgi:glutathione S-transferase